MLENHDILKAQSDHLSRDAFLQRNRNSSQTFLWLIYSNCSYFLERLGMEIGRGAGSC